MSQLVSLIQAALQTLSGVRTYLAATATILTAIATAAGQIDLNTGNVVIVVCLALAQAFQRLATAKSTDDLTALLEELQKNLPVATAVHIANAQSLARNTLPTRYFEGLGPIKNQS